MLVVICHVVDAGKIARVLVAVYIIVLHAAYKNVARKTFVSEFFGVVDNAEQKFTVYHKHIGKNVDRAAVFIAGNYLSDPAAAVYFQLGTDFFVAFFNLFSAVNHRYVRVFFDMITQHLTEIDVAHVVAVGHDDVSFGSFAQIVCAVGNCLEP